MDKPTGEAANRIMQWELWCSVQEDKIAELKKSRITILEELIEDGLTYDSDYGDMIPVDDVKSIIKTLKGEIGRAHV